MKKCKDCGKATQRTANDQHQCWACAAEKIMRTGTDLERSALSNKGTVWEKHGLAPRVYLHPSDVLDIKVTVNGQPLDYRLLNTLTSAKCWVSGNNVYVDIATETSELNSVIVRDMVLRSLTQSSAPSSSPTP